MPVSIDRIIYRFASKSKQILGNKLSKVILYGSYARGDYQKNSNRKKKIKMKIKDDQASG